MAAHDTKQPELAAVLGIKQQSVSGLITGSSKYPNAKNALRICAFYKVRPEWFILDKGPQAAVGELTPEESRLVDLFRRISPAGQAYLLARAQELLDSEHPSPPSIPPGLDSDRRPKPPGPH